MRYIIRSMKVKAPKMDLKTIFEIAKTPDQLEKLLKDHNYISDSQLRYAKKLVSQRVSLLRRLK